jgi:hypothetical protein
MDLIPENAAKLPERPSRFGNRGKQSSDARAIGAFWRCYCCCICAT